jgi:hypothetical protein
MMKAASFKSLLLVASLVCAPFAFAQTESEIRAADHPLPDIPTLMHEVEQHQRASEGIQKDYLYHEVATEEGNGKKAETREYDVFWLNGVEVHKLTRKDGRDLTADEQKKESEHVDKEVAKAKERKSKAEAKGQQTDPTGHEEITVSRFLSLGTFTNPRRVQLDGRDTIVVDYTGDPKAKTRNRTEDVIRDLAGTIWIDEQDRSISRLEGHFVNNFKIGAGLVINVKKDTSFLFVQRKINGEVWLQTRIEGQGAARVMLFVNFNGSVRVINSDYRKFKATSTILPGVATVNEPSATESAPLPTADNSTSPNPQ